jgi:enoyl-CoA hydratase
MADIEFETPGRIGLITLNRPKALNALTHQMVLALEGQLDAWAADPAVEAVVIRGEGERAFCAGGDTRALYEAGRPGGERGQANFPFFADEYRMNTKIKRLPKPYIALMNGITMGGGVGVSVHGSLRVATERTVFAMPETGIGLFPDVGGTYFLPRLPGSLGMWLGLTGSRLKGEETVLAGVCDCMLGSDGLPELVDFLAHGLDWRSAGGDWRAALARQGLRFEVDGVLDHVQDIHFLFSFGSVELILEALGNAGSGWAARQRELILSKSPTCTRIAQRQISMGKDMEFEDCMRLEYRLARFCMTRPDFYEGVRALLIDKDNSPKWDPPTLAEATCAFVAPAFKPLGDEELRL